VNGTYTNKPNSNEKAKRKYHFCLDFRKVNSISKKDAYPLPNMNGILDNLRSARYISTIDLSQAYFQISLATDSREITTFSVLGKGLYHFTRMPYGLTGASTTFQRLLDKLIGPEMEPHAFASIFEEYLEWLDRVLNKIIAAGLTVNREKCEFCRSQIRYLGFIVQRSVYSKKVKPILEYPRNIKQLRRFLGMPSWYRRFVLQFATVSEANRRTHLSKFAPDRFRFQHCRAQILMFHLYSGRCSASSAGLDAVLTQTISDTENIIASRALSDPKKNSVTKQECLVVVWAIQSFGRI